MVRSSTRYLAFILIAGSHCPKFVCNSCKRWTIGLIVTWVEKDLGSSGAGTVSWADTDTMQNVTKINTEE